MPLRHSRVRGMAIEEQYPLTGSVFTVRLEALFSYKSPFQKPCLPQAALHPSCRCRRYTRTQTIPFGVPRTLVRVDACEVIVINASRLYTITKFLFSSVWRDIKIANLYKPDILPRVDRNGKFNGISREKVEHIVA